MNTPVIFAQVLYFLSTALLAAVAYYFGYQRGNRDIEHRYGKDVGRLLDHMRKEMREQEEEEVGHMMLHMSEAVFAACRALDVEAMTTEICRQLDIVPTHAPSEEVVLPVMHMMRANHPEFTEAERVWSRAWLDKNSMPSGADFLHHRSPTVN